MVKILNPRQFGHALLHIVQSALHILIGTDVFPKDLNVDLFFIQNIGINKILDVINRFKCQSLGNQTEKFILNSSQPCCYHFSGFHLGLAPLSDLQIGTTEFSNRFHLVSIEEKIIRNPGIFHEITNRCLLSLRSRIHHCTDDEIPVFTLLIKLQCHMSTDFSGSLIRTGLFSGFAANVASELTLAVLMGSLVEIACCTDDHELNGIQKR